MPALRSVVLLGALLVGACTTTSRPSPPSASRGDGPAPGTRLSAYEQRLHDTARVQARMGRLAEAATAWEILTVMRPEVADYRAHLDDTRRQIEAVLPDRLQRGLQAQQRGDLDSAQAQLLGVLALQPENAIAAESLRAIERERNRRTVLGKPSRLTLTKRVIADSQMTGSRQAVPIDRSDVELAAMLGAQGEFEEAIALLESHVAAEHGDEAACRLLADLYFRKAERKLPSDKAAAIAAFEKSLKLDATNARTQERLKTLKGGAGTVKAAAPIRARAPAAATARTSCGA